MDEIWREIFEKMGKKETFEKFIRWYFYSELEKIKEKKNDEKEYFPSIFYLKSHSIICSSVYGILSGMIKFLCENDSIELVRMRAIVFKKGRFENDWRNHVLNIFKYSHNLFHNSGETFNYLNFTPAIYQNRFGNAFEVQQLKFYIPTLNALGLEQEVEQFERIFNEFSIKQLAFSASSCSAFWSKNTKLKRQFR